MNQSPTIRRYDLSTLSASERLALLRRRDLDHAVATDGARAIIAAVGSEGDEALARFVGEAHDVDFDPCDLQVTDGDFVQAFERLDPDVTRAIDTAVDMIRDFHEAQMPEDIWLKEIKKGAFVGNRHRPIPSVACCVRGGDGGLPSEVIMATMPAVTAGVPKVVILTPAGPDGGVDDATLVAAAKVGVGEVYKCSGAAAVAAAALGTDTVPKVDKIIGSAEPELIAATRLLVKQIDVGLIAGPPEAIILADDGADADIVALDLVSSSERSPDGAVFLVTTSADLADAVGAAVDGRWSGMRDARAACSKAVLAGPSGGLVVAPSMRTAIEFVNDFAPACLHVLCRDPFTCLSQIDHAGEILLGPCTPPALASYILGPDAMRPTGGGARLRSPLSVFDFLKRSSIGHVTPEAFSDLAAQARVLANHEGLDGHASAVAADRGRTLPGQTISPKMS